MIEVLPTTDHQVQAETGPDGPTLTTYLGDSLTPAARITAGAAATPYQLEQLAQEAERWAAQLREAAFETTLFG